MSPSSILSIFILKYGLVCFKTAVIITGQEFNEREQNKEDHFIY